MYPVLFRIGGLEITSFGVMVALAGLVGLWLFRRELLRARLPEDGVDAAVAGLAGGLAGAKGLWVLEHLGDDTFASLLFSRGGMSWFGGLVGGVGLGLWWMRRRRWPVVPMLSAATPALAAGHAVGRIGCLLVGDDYGRPTSLPWGIPFPEGLPPTAVPVHPTQVYEAIALVPIAWLLIGWRRRGVPDAEVIGRYLVLTGLLRFAIEFIRVNERVALGLTVAHWVSLAVIVAGGAAIATVRRRAPAARPS